MNGIPSTHKIFAFIQARTTSTRLPNKVLKPFVNNKCILDFLIERIEKILPKSKILLLIPYNDSPLIEYAKEKQVFYFEGSELNVRDRFIQAAQYFQADWILRLTGDNPFVDLEHLQYLIEATRFTNYDLISFEFLPIGTGGEIFKTSALCREPKLGLTQEHKEHVSLHIKQFPEEFSVLRLSSFLEDYSNINKIRLTIDENLDFQTCKEIFFEFQNNEFGAQEILNLYKSKPHIFEKNQTVNQVRFSTSIKHLAAQPKVLLVHAPVKEHGSAHLRRMKLLKIYLESLGFYVEITEHINLVSDSNYEVCLLDYRDSWLPKNSNSKKWIKLDNFSFQEGEETYFYTLPHFQLKQDTYQTALLVPLSFFLVEPPLKRKGILIYAGGVKDSELLYLLEWVKNSFQNQKIFIVGKKIQDSQFQSFSSLPYFAFYNLILSAEYFISYFGQSLLEAFHLGCKCFSFSISEYHTELSKFLETHVSIPFLGELYKKNLVFQSLHQTSSPSTHIFGFEKLISLIQNKLKKLD